MLHWTLAGQGGVPADSGRFRRSFGALHALKTRGQGAVPQLVQSGIPMYTGAAERFLIAATETSHHLVYFISDLPGEQNTQLLMAMAPSIQQILQKRAG